MIEVIDSIPWVRCASGNVFFIIYITFITLRDDGLEALDRSDWTDLWSQLMQELRTGVKVKMATNSNDETISNNKTISNDETFSNSETFSNNEKISSAETISSNKMISIDETISNDETISS